MRWTLTSGYTPGCIGRIAQLHAEYYHPLVGFGLPFESRVARELAQFCERFTPTQDGLWLVRDAATQTVHGSIAIDGAQAATRGAHLRWFITSDALRGQGMGRTLLHQAMAFCKQHGHSRVYLSTFEGLHAARHLYEGAGFKLTHQALGQHWGAEVNEQWFEYASESQAKP
jgi:RimJ/RimL family protein N-acetyltransferase